MSIVLQDNLRFAVQNSEELSSDVNVLKELAHKHFEQLETVIQRLQGYYLPSSCFVTLLLLQHRLVSCAWRL